MRIEKCFQSPKGKNTAGFLEPWEQLCIIFTLWFFFYTSVSSLLLRRPTFSATCLLVWMGEDGFPLVILSQVILSDNGDWLSWPSPNSQVRDAEWSSLSPMFTADSIPYFQVDVGAPSYKHGNQWPIPEDGELGPAVKGVMLSWENTCIRGVLHNYYVICISTWAWILCCYLTDEKSQAQRGHTASKYQSPSLNLGLLPPNVIWRENTQNHLSSFAFKVCILIVLFFTRHIQIYSFSQFLMNTCYMQGIMLSFMGNMQPVLKMLKSIR